MAKTLVKAACVQFKYMELINDYNGQTREECIDLFFSQSLIKECLDNEKTNLSQQIITLYRFLEIADFSKEQCMNFLNNLTYKFYNIEIKNLEVDYLNKVLKFIDSNYTVVSSVEGVFFKISLVKEKNYKKFKHVFWIEKEFLIFPSIKNTLAASTIAQNIYLRQSCFEFMYNMKWKSFFSSTSFLPYFSMGAEFTISNCFQQLATQNLDKISEETYKKQILENIVENVYYHEHGHFCSHLELDAEILAIMKKAPTLNFSLLESLDECYADCFSMTDFTGGTLISIAQIAKTNNKKAIDMFFAYASDTWFFDTNDDDMMEYSEMFHLILLRYISKKDQKIHFNQIEKDFNLADPKSVLTKLVTTVNSLALELKTYLKNQKYTIKQNEYTFSFLDNIARKQVEESFKSLDPYSYKYLTNYWNKIFVAVNKFLPDQSGLDAFKSNLKKRYIKFYLNFQQKNL